MTNTISPNFVSYSKDLWGLCNLDNPGKKPIEVMRRLLLRSPVGATASIAGLSAYLLQVVQRNRLSNFGYCQAYRTTISR